MSHCTERFHWRTLWCSWKNLLSKNFIHRRGAEHHGFVEIFCFTGRKRKALSRNPSVFWKFSGIEKNLWKRGAYHDFQSKNLCLTVPKTIVRESYCITVFEKSLVSKSFMNGKEVSRFSVGKLWSHIAEKFRKRILLFFEKNFVFKKFCGWKGRYQIFPSESFDLTVPKNSWASVQGFRKLGASKTFMHIRGITFFRRKFFVPQCRELSLENPTVFVKSFGFKKFYVREGGYHVFPSESFGPTVPKNLVGIPSMFQKLGGIENFYAYWGYQDSPSKISGLTVPKSFVIIPSMSQKNWGIEKFYAY